MAGDRGIDHGVDQLLDAGFEFFAHVTTSQIDTVPEFPRRANWPSVGSAQQNQGSVTRGGRLRFRAGAAKARSATPAARSASSRTRWKVTAASSRSPAARATAAETWRYSVSMRGSGCVQA